MEPQQKIGYRVSMVTMEGDRAVKYQPFAYGWLNDALKKLAADQWT